MYHAKYVTKKNIDNPQLTLEELYKKKIRSSLTSVITAKKGSEICISSKQIVYDAVNSYLSKLIEQNHRQDSVKCFRLLNKTAVT